MSEARVMNADVDLLAVVEDVLQGQGFLVAALPGSVPLVLAESPYFLIAVGALHTIGDLISSQGLAETSLLERLDAETIGPKKWDIYLVLLTRESSPEDDVTTRDLYAINYDTSRLRRIAHTGVVATKDSVAHALAPFLAPVETATVETVEAPFAALLSALIGRGVERQLAERAIAAFEQGASLDDVL